MNKHAGKHIRCIIKSRKVFFIAGKQLESGDPHWGLFNDLPFPYEPSVKIQLICQRIFGRLFAASLIKPEAFDKASL